MATDPGTVEFLLDQLGTRGASYSTKRMFGEYCLYREGNPVAFVCDDVLFVKDTSAGRASMTAAGLLDFGPPYPGAKNYLRLPPDGWDDGEWLRALLDATASELPAAKIRKSSTAEKPAATAKSPSSETSRSAKNASAAARNSRPSQSPATSATRAKKSASEKVAAKAPKASKPFSGTSRAKRPAKR